MLPCFLPSSALFRVQAQVGPEYGVLACTVFVDALAIDKGGFISDTGCHVTLANVRRKYRHNNTAKAPICVLPSVSVPPAFRKRAVYTRFKNDLLHWALRKIFEPAREFNRRGGMVLRVPGGSYVLFKRFVLLNLTADSPQATQIAMTGSACWECEAPVTAMGDDVVNYPRRTPASNAAHRATFQAVLDGPPGGKTAARERAKVMGVALRGECGLGDPEGAAPGWGLCGPDARLDHLYAALMAGRLHLIDEGMAVLTLKVGLKLAVESHCRRNPLANWNAASAKHRKAWEGGMRNHVHAEVDRAVTAIARQRPRCSNVELEEIGPFTHFNHGLTEFIHKDRRLNALKYVPGVRLLHLTLVSSTLLTPAEKVEYFALCELLFEVAQALSRPLHKSRVADVSALFARFRLALLALHRPLSKSKGQHIKCHMSEHVVAATVQLGWWADEKRDENALAQFFKKQASRTNGRESRVSQTAAAARRLHRLEDVCGWHGIASTLRITWRAAAHSEAGSFDVSNSQSVALGRSTFTPAQMRRWAPAAFVMMLEERHPEFEGYEFSTAIKLCIRNRAKRSPDSNWFGVVILRNYPRFHGHPWVDVIKYGCLGDDGNKELHFGQCVCFARAPDGEHYMGLRIYTYGRSDNRPPGSLEPLLLAPALRAASYILMPVSSIHSGALVIEDPNKAGGCRCFAVLAPREARELHAVNGWG